MRERALGSLFVVAVGIVPTLIGGPVFAGVLIILGMVGFLEYLALVSRVSAAHSGDSSGSVVGFGVILGFGIAALFGADATALFVVCATAVVAPLIAFMRYSTTAGYFQRWSLVSVGSLYLGLPVFAAVTLRSLPHESARIWLLELPVQLGGGWRTGTWGLAWVLTVILSIWVGDSSAFLIGRFIGSHKLAPDLSPNKTVEGAVGGLGGAVIVGALSFPIFGLGDWWFGAVTGAVIGAAGQLGDLGESFLKRQAGVKESGSIIPGHGGILDRLDALLFAFPVGLVLAASYDRFS
ncbi:MAG: phosphatidate cytidylyltransferase [Chloroflexia bacterium]|nr:phosphatidate cytidylyltransferase [Chloroflexia bacterium]